MVDPFSGISKLKEEIIAVTITQALLNLKHSGRIRQEF